MDKKQFMEMCKALSNETRVNILIWLKDPEKHFPGKKLHLSPDTADCPGGICVGSIQDKAGIRNRRFLTIWICCSVPAYCRQNALGAGLTIAATNKRYRNYPVSSAKTYSLMISHQKKSVCSQEVQSLGEQALLFCNHIFGGKALLIGIVAFQYFDGNESVVGFVLGNLDSRRLGENQDFIGADEGADRFHVAVAAGF